jgi:hypothetical protein
MENSLNNPRGTCIVCGCTDARACPGGCFWIDEEHTLCSACAGLGNQNGTEQKKIEQKLTGQLDPDGGMMMRRQRRPVALGVGIHEQTSKIMLGDVLTKRIFVLLTTDMAREVAAHMLQLADEADIAASARDDGPG